MTVRLPDTLTSRPLPYRRLDTSPMVTGAFKEICADFGARRSHIFIKRPLYCWPKWNHIPCSETQIQKNIMSLAPGVVCVSAPPVNGWSGRFSYRWLLLRESGREGGRESCLFGTHSIRRQALSVPLRPREHSEVSPTVRRG